MSPSFPATISVSIMWLVVTIEILARPLVIAFVIALIITLIVAMVVVLSLIVVEDD